MTIFVIIRQADRDSDRLASAIAENYIDDFYALSDGVWLVSDHSTAMDVSRKVGITSASDGPPTSLCSAVVIEAASYYGRANPAIWSWIKTKWEGGQHG